LNGPADLNDPVKLSETLPVRLKSVFSPENLLRDTVAWAAPCISGRGRRIPANLFGALVATNEEPHKISFASGKPGRPFLRAIDLEDSVVTHESKFLSENLVISPAAGGGPKYLFIFPRPHAALVEQIVRDLRQRLSEPALQEQKTPL